MKIKYGDLIRIIIKDGGLEMIALEYEDITSLCDVFYRVRKYLITSGLCIPVRVTVINFDRSVYKTYEYDPIHYIKSYLCVVVPEYVTTTYCDRWFFLAMGRAFSDRKTF